MLGHPNFGAIGLQPGKEKSNWNSNNVHRKKRFKDLSNFMKVYNQNLSKDRHDRICHPYVRHVLYNTRKKKKGEKICIGSCLTATV